MDDFVLWSIISIGLIVFAIVFLRPLDNVPDNKEP